MKSRCPVPPAVPTNCLTTLEIFFLNLAFTFTFFSVGTLHHKAPPSHLQSLPIPPSDDDDPLSSLFCVPAHALRHPVESCLQSLDLVFQCLCLGVLHLQSDKLKISPLSSNPASFTGWLTALSVLLISLDPISSPTVSANLSPSSKSSSFSIASHRSARWSSLPLFRLSDFLVLPPLA